MKIDGNSQSIDLYNTLFIDVVTKAYLGKQQFSGVMKKSSITYFKSLRDFNDFPCIARVDEETASNNVENRRSRHSQ